MGFGDMFGDMWQNVLAARGDVQVINRILTDRGAFDQYDPCKCDMTK